MTIIKSKGFVLRPFKKTDEESLVENINDSLIYRYTCRIPHPYTRKDANKFITEIIKEKGETAFAIDIQGKVVGCVGLHNIKKHKAEIGYWLGEKYWGKGIVSVAVKLVTKYAFGKLKVSRVYAPIFKQNKASARVLEKNGYKLEGILRKDHVKDGKFIDLKMYAKVK
ncbi:GNAT family N-acetyltransferase [Candidatus Woesearchaeota archaeon]|nr:GNAT family N-acetyltransferase [Candidatus Woesearchaeota archaeon]